MLLLPLLLLAAALAPERPHQALNPLFRELRDTGAQVGADIKIALPAPTMADGLDAQTQEAVVKQVAGEDYPLEELARNSVVAPHILRLRNLSPSDPAAPARGLDVWFVAYGDLGTVADKDFLDRLLRSNQKEGTSRDLTTADLTRRGITLSRDNAKHESYAHIAFSFLDRVRISVAGHSFWSRTDDSVLIASRIDPRFRDDPDFPNRWRPLSKDEDGKPQLGLAHPYGGAAYYMKVTRLAEPKGALFVEGHVIFPEPVKWFDGANLLRSKLPPVVQSHVRSMRRELLKAAKSPRD
jgi:hypothetical protein